MLTVTGDLAAEIDSHGIDELVYAGGKTITADLNWKLANDTFGETYHFKKLHKNTLGRLFIGNNLHFKEFGRQHRFVTANNGIQRMRELPESEWQLTRATFVLYYLFPNIQLIVNDQRVTMVRIYPDLNNPGRSKTQISFYYHRKRSITRTPHMRTLRHQRMCTTRRTLRAADQAWLHRWKSSPAQLNTKTM